MIPQFRSRLLRWYRVNRRVLPWRDVQDPYATWVSEVMLQQTQAQTVIPYFERFIARLPTVRSLAEARVEEVLKLWEGLGYYARARNLHAGAQKVVKEFGGEIPWEVEKLRTLPGVGRYTAGAIASIAFNRPEPILDGNVTRVLSRAFRVEGDLRRNPAKAKLWSLAAELAKAAKGQIGDLNQALMELGAVVCTPVQPVCLKCPTSKLCEANRLGLQAALPEISKGPATVRLEHAAAIVRRNGTYLIAQRPLDGVWGGLWEFPRTERRPDESLPSAAARAAKEGVNLTVEVVEELATVTHSFTHYRVTLHAFTCHLVSGRPGSRFYQRLAWVRMEKLEDYVFPAPQVEVVKRLQGRD